MPTTFARLLALAMCVGLFVVTCPLAQAHSVSSPSTPSKCCSLAEDTQHCAGSEMEDNEPMDCCLTHGCSSVIAIATGSVVASFSGTPQLVLTFAQRTAHQSKRPPVPPPRTLPV